MAASTIIPRTLTAVTVTTAGTSKPASAISLQVYSLVIVSLSTNTGVQYIGDSTVSSANGMPIAPDGDFTFEPPDMVKGDTFDANKVYLDSSTSGAEFRIMAWIRG